MTIVKNDAVQPSTTTTGRRTYQAPKLTEFGDVRHLTAAGTAGGQENGTMTGVLFML